MRSRTLLAQLVRVGLSAGRNTPGGRLRFFALLSASAVLAVLLTSVLAVVATYDGWDRRDVARGPDIARQRDASAAVAWYRWQSDSVGTTPHEIILVEPRTRDLDPPPGLPRWPEPGEAFLSPELIRAGEAEGITQRYGRFAGVIGDDGLLTPSERLAYVRPRVDSHRSWLPIRQIGSPLFPIASDTLNRVPLGQLVGTIGLTFGGAALVLLMVAARCGSTVRDNRTHLLAVLGGSWWHRAMVNVGEALIPVTIGTALGGAPYLVMTRWTARIPLIEQSIHPADLRGWLWDLPVALLGGWVLALVAVVALHRTARDGTSTRPRVFTGSVPRWRLMLGLAGLLAVVSTPYLGKAASFFAYVGGTAALWGMLPSTAAVAIRRAGTAVAAFGRRTGHTAALIAGRWADARPGVVVRLVAVVVIGIGAITQAQVWSSRLGSAGQSAHALLREVRDAVLVVTPQSITPESIGRFRRALPSTMHLLMVTTGRPPTGTTRIQGPCPAFHALGISCPTTAQPLTGGDVRSVLLREHTAYDGPVTIEKASLRSAVSTADSIALISPIGSANLAPKVKQAAYEAFGVAQVDRPYDTYLLGSDRLVTMASWVRLLTILMLSILLLAMVISAAAEFLAFTTSVAPLVVLSEQRRLFAGIALWNLTLPTMIAIAFGVAMAAWQGTFFITMTGAGVFSWPVLWLSTAMGVGLAATVGLVSGVGAVRAAARWRPTPD